MTSSDKSPRSPLPLVLAVAAITLGLVVWHLWADYDDMVTHSAEVAQTTKASACTARILHLDEVLTMSARMAAATGDKAWIDRYRQFAPELDNLIKEAKSLTPTAEGLGGAAATDKANEELVRMEEASFELVLQGKQDEAWALLTGPEYMRQKDIYAAGMDAFVKEIETQRQNKSASQQRHLLLFQIAQCAIAIALMGLWYFILRRVASRWRSHTDQLRALADSLRVSEKRYRILFESSRDALMTLAPPSWKFTSGNPAAVKLFGTKNAAEFTALGPWELSPELQPDGRPSAEKAKEMIETAMREGSHSFEWTHKRLGGEDFPATVLLTRMELAGQTLLQATVRDVTAQKRAEEALRLARDRAQNYLDIAGVVLVALDAEGTITLLNHKGCELLGCCEEEALGKNWFETFIPERCRDRVRGIFAELMAGNLEAAEYEENEVRSLGGEERIIAWHNTPLRDASGGIAGTLSSGEDITERKRMEHELRRLAFIAQQAAEGIAVADLEGNLQFVNDAWARMHGYVSGAELVGRHLSIFHTDEQLKTDVIPFNNVVIQRGHNAGEVGHVRKDGTTFPAQMMVTLLKDERGEPYGLAGFAQDVTNRKRAEEERQKTLHRQQGISLLSQSLLAAGPLEGKLKTVTDNIVRLFDADFCRIWLIRPGDLCERGCVHAEVHEGPHVCRYRDRCLHLLASSGRYTHTDGKGHRRVPFGCYKIGRVASGQEHKFLTNDAVNDPRVHNHQWARELGLVAFAGYQLRAPGGETLGVLALFAKHPISPEEDAMLDALSSAVALVAQQAAAETALQQANVRLEELATTDALTGLANRRRFMEVLEAEFQRSRRYGGRLALAMVDVDRFKLFNDAHGHAFGDRVIVEVAKRLAAEARQTDVVARLGGDEFVVLMPETSADEAVRAAERIRKTVSKDPISDGEQSVPATVSVGIATVADGKAGTPENLLKQADDAMYAAKEAGRNRVCLAPSEKAVSPAP